jgi:four helix bundle protein
MYIYDLAWHDCDLLMKDPRGREVSRQLIRSIGSVSANFEEAYGRGIESADALRILRIALGEAREARGWYLRVKLLLSQDCLNKRLDLLSDLIGMLVNIILIAVDHRISKRINTGKMRNPYPATCILHKLIWRNHNVTEC